MNTILSLSKQLISIPSVKENKKALHQVLNVARKHLQGFTVEKFESNGYPSLLVYTGKTRPKKFKLILNAHLDVVAAPNKLFKPIIKSNRLYGRGAIDMKAAAAVEILVFKKLAKKLSYPLGLQLVTDEEIGGFAGTKHQIQKGVKAKFVITGEPTDLKIGYKAKGIIWIIITTKGKTGHGAHLWHGNNAVWKMISILNDLKKAFPVPKTEKWTTTLNLSQISVDNPSFNKVPDNCQARLDIRYIPKDKQKILRRLKNIIGSRAKIKIITQENSIEVSPNNTFFKKLTQTIKTKLHQKPQLLLRHGGSDLSHYSSINNQGVEFGPIGQGLHANNEWVDIKSLDTFYQILKDYLTQL